MLMFGAQNQFFIRGESHDTLPVEFYARSKIGGLGRSIRTEVVGFDVAIGGAESLVKGPAEAHQVGGSARVVLFGVRVTLCGVGNCREEVEVIPGESQCESV